MRKIIENLFQRQIFATKLIQACTIWLKTNYWFFFYHSIARINEEKSSYYISNKNIIFSGASTHLQPNAMIPLPEPEGHMKYTLDMV